VKSKEHKLKILKRKKGVKRSERESSVRGRPIRFFIEWLNFQRVGLFILPTLSLFIALFLFPNILNKPKIYRIGDVADRDIKASQDYLIEDKELIEKNRERAVRGVLSVYDFEGSVEDTVYRIKEAFDSGREYHRRSMFFKDPEQMTAYAGKKTAPESLEGSHLFRSRFFEILDIPPDEEIFDHLMEYGFPNEAEQMVVQLITRVFEKGIVGNSSFFMDQMERGGIILHHLETEGEIKVTNPEKFFGLDGAKGFIERQRESLGKGKIGPELANTCTKLAQYFVRPNLTFNKRETELRKDFARQSVKPTYFKIKKGEMIVREGERIGPDHIVKLAGEAIGHKTMDIFGRVPAMAILIGFLFTVIYTVVLKGMRSFKGERRELLFNSLTLFGLFIFTWAYSLVADEIARGYHFLTYTSLLFAMPVAFGAMLVSIFQGLNLAVSFSLLISVFASLIMGGRVEFFIYFFISSLLAAYGVRSCTERGILIKTGLKVGLVNIIMSLSIMMIQGSIYSVESLVAAMSGFLGGLLSGVIATGILPMIEMSFRFTTDIKLLELANLDQPLLRELMVQSPGTYHHSVIISNMVEATAKAVNANPLLARVSAFYHDIGKIRKPLYFIENQRAGENRHEKLAPSMSSLILISHVKDGIELAKSYKLGREITDIIQQHHGTSLISYFYQKAKEQMVKKANKSTSVKEEDFRYPGPKPQTKEAGLVMLADMVEAASRSLRDPTPARIQGMVQKILNKVFSDGQLDECELTLKDLHEIAKSFNKTLSGIFHHRVEYPESSPKAAKRANNGYSDQVSKQSSWDKKSEDKTESEAGLRRLGLT
jgi:putative nucleotidyltransferase with HDIG domain